MNEKIKLADEVLVNLLVDEVDEIKRRIRLELVVLVTGEVYFWLEATTLK